MLTCIVCVHENFPNKTRHWRRSLILLLHRMLNGDNDANLYLWLLSGGVILPLWRHTDNVLLQEITKKSMANKRCRHGRLSLIFFLLTSYRGNIWLQRRGVAYCSSWRHNLNYYCLLLCLAFHLHSVLLNEFNLQCIRRAAYMKKRGFLIQGVSH